MKWIKRLLVVIVILIAGGVLAGYLLIDGIVKSVVEKQGTEQLKVPTTLGGVSLGLIHGTVDLDSLAIGSPSGFTAPQMFSVGKFAVDIGGVMRLRDEPIHISTVTIDQPTLVIEQNGGKLNFRELMNNLPSSNQPKDANPSVSGESKPVKVIIDTLTISNAHVKVQSDSPIKGLDLSALNKDISLPTMTLKNIGNADGANNGAALKDVATSIISKMVDQTTKTGGLPIDFNKSLTENLNGVTDKLDQAAQKQLDKYKVPVDVGGILNQFTKDKKQP
jgi:hypothetical protein